MYQSVNTIQHERHNFTNNVFSLNFSSSKSHRTKRDTINSIMLQCRQVFAATCSSSACQKRARQRLLNQIKSVSEVTNVPVQVSSREFGSTSGNLNLQFVAIDSNRKFI